MNAKGICRIYPEPATKSYPVPRDFIKILTIFAAQCRMDRPDDIIIYAIDYFTNIRNERTKNREELQKERDLKYVPVSKLLHPVTSEEAIFMRHPTVRGESYDLEQLMEQESVEIVPKSDQVRENIRNALVNCFLFRDFTDLELNIVIDSMSEERVYKNQCVLLEGEQCDTFYAIEKGPLEILKKIPYVREPILVRVCKEGDCFNEASLLYNKFNDYSVFAINSAVLWTIHRTHFRQLLLRHGKTHGTHKEQLLSLVPMFKNMSADECRRLADSLVPFTYPKGTNVYTQGDFPDGMFIIESGTAKLSIRGKHNKDVGINNLGPNSFFGELAMVSNRHRPLTVIAEDMLFVQYLSVETLERVVGPCLEIMRRDRSTAEQEILKIIGSNTNTDDLRHPTKQ